MLSASEAQPEIFSIMQNRFPLWFSREETEKPTENTGYFWCFLNQDFRQWEKGE
jgi:hypothetical protein